MPAKLLYVDGKYEKQLPDYFPTGELVINGFKVGEVRQSAVQEDLGYVWKSLPYNARRAILQAAYTFLVDGKKINAIMLIRGTADIGLKEAKEFCEDYDFTQDPHMPQDY